MTQPTKTSVRVETASLADAETLARLNENVHRLHVEAVPHVFKPPAYGEVVAFFQELLGRDNLRAFIAYAGDVAVGYVVAFTYEQSEATFQAARRWLYIDQISVEPDWQDQGVGRALVEAALHHAREASLENIEVSTWAFNTVAQSFFKSMGFQPKTHRFWLKLET